MRKKVVTPSFVSKSIRLPDVHSMLAESADGAVMEQLCRCYKQVSSPSQVAHHMYLDRHPDYLKAQARAHHSEQSRQILTAALYRTDPPAMFMSLKASKRQHVRAVAKAGRFVRPLRGIGRQERRLEDVLAAGTPAAAFEHLREVAKPLEFYSFQRAGVQVHSIDIALQAVSPEVRVPQMMVEEPRIFFRTLHCYPNRVKTSHLPTTRGGRLQATDIVVSVHVNQGTVDEPLVMLDASATNTAAVILRGLHLCSHDALQSGFLKWSSEETLYVSVKDFVPDCGAEALHRCLLRFLQADALPPTGRVTSKHYACEY